MSDRSGVMAEESRWPELGSAEDAHRTHRWARECMLMWEAEREKFVEGLVELYRSGCRVEVARVCDEIIDPSGYLLGVVRQKARGA